MNSFFETLRMIKIEHSVFALPFALASAFLAARGIPETRLLVLILIAMVSARSSAMAFNRYLDAGIDEKNPRTRIRSIPAGKLSRTYVLGFTILAVIIFETTCFFINPLTFKLSPVIILVLLGYSVTKRFTSMCHFVLGIALGLAPVGAWVAIRESLEFTPFLLGTAVVFWTAGFDIIYSCQDFSFDKKEGLHSIPVLFGVSNSLSLARTMHILTLIILVNFGTTLQLSMIYWVGLILVSLTLLYEHYLVRGGDLSRVNMAFFTMNGVVSLIFGGMTIAAIF
jgi:4-hydroxybenzoate polyprenyltransferase